MTLRAIIVVFAFGCLLAVPAPSNAQMTPLAVMNCTASNFADCGGWQPRPVNAYWTRRFVQGGGPQGQDAVEISQLTSSVHAQYYLGWSGPSLPNPAQGAVRYLRMRFKTVGTVSLNGVSDVWSDKFIIVADGDNPTGRVICHLRDNGISSDNLAISCSRNIDGYPNATQGYVPLPRDQWSNLQFEFKSSSTTSSANGSIKIWRNQNSYSAPSTQSGQFQLNAIGWGAISIGSYANATLASGGRVVFQLADVEWDDQFDPNYNVGGGTSSAPAPPQNLRISETGFALLSLGAFGAVLFIRDSRRS
jgi:hypothetical protein